MVEGSTHPAQPTAPGATSLQGLVASVPPQLGEDTARRGETCMAWMNALVGRIFWDFLREQYWAEQVSSKIQKKLSKIKVRGRSITAPRGPPSPQRVPGCGDHPRVVSLHQLPYFMNELTLTELDMGTSIPLVLSASNPTINDRGKSPVPEAGRFQQAHEQPSAPTVLTGVHPVPLPGRALGGHGGHLQRLVADDTGDEDEPLQAGERERCRGQQPGRGSWRGVRRLCTAGFHPPLA